jgi:hypothetical protein
MSERFLPFANTAAGYLAQGGDASNFELVIPSDYEDSDPEDCGKFEGEESESDCELEREDAAMQDAAAEDEAEKTVRGVYGKPHCNVNDGQGIAIQRSAAQVL